MPAEAQAQKRKEVARANASADRVPNLPALRNPSKERWQLFHRTVGWIERRIGIERNDATLGSQFLQIGRDCGRSDPHLAQFNV